MGGAASIRDPHFFDSPAAWLGRYNTGMSGAAEAVAREFVRAINRQDGQALAALMTEEHCFTDSLGNSVRGRAAMRAGWVGYFKMAPDYAIAVEESYGDEIGREAGPSTPSAAADSAQDDRLLSNGVVVLLGVAAGTYTKDGMLRAENRWETPVAIRARIEDGLVAEWRVYADNEPMRVKMRGAGA